MIAFRHANRELNCIKAPMRRGVELASLCNRETVRIAALLAETAMGGDRTRRAGVQVCQCDRARQRTRTAKFLSALVCCPREIWAFNRPGVPPGSTMAKG